MLNREYINSLDDKEFVEFLLSFRRFGCKYCAFTKDCSIAYNNDDCTKGYYKWLSMEHKNKK